MRICIPSRSLDTFGGAERVVISDAEHFARSGHDVHLITDEFDPDVLSSYGLPSSVTTHRITVSRHGPLPETFYRAYEIRRLLRTIGADAVIAHYQEVPTWLALSTLDIDPVFVSHVHGSVLWFQNNDGRTVHMWKECTRDLIAEVPGHSEFWAGDDTTPLQKVRTVGVEAMEAMALRSCDEVFVNTQQVSRELNCLYGVDPAVNPPGVDGDWDPNPTDETLPVEPPFVFSLSRLDPRKRVDLLIDAFAQFREHRPEFGLVVGGTGPRERHLKRLAAEAGVSEAVTFVGHIEESVLPTYYSLADIFACPGWMSYGLTPLEAVRCGTKVALSTDAFAKEVIGDQPGVEVLNPDVRAWRVGLEELAECEATPASDGLPTISEHAEAKLAALRG